MNSTIYKYPVQPNASIEMPRGAQILSAAIQADQPCIWALVDPQAERETRHFVTVPTGGTIDPAGKQYVGTFHGIEGWMVIHLFEIK